jgi:hypothetical protein
MSKNTKINFKLTEKEVKVLGNLLFYFEDFQKTKKENKKDWLEKLFCNAYMNLQYRPYKGTDSDRFVSDHYLLNLYSVLYMDYEKSETIDESFKKLEELTNKQMEEMLELQRKRIEEK